jgi:hypothetical protein
MPIFEKPVDPAEIDADGLAYEVMARLQKQRGVSVVTVGTKVKPSPRDDPHLDHADSGARGPGQDRWRGCGFSCVQYLGQGSSPASAMIAA